MSSPAQPGVDISAVLAELAKTRKELQQARDQIARLEEQLHELRALVHRRTRKDKKPDPDAPEPKAPAPATEEQKKAFHERPEPPPLPAKAKKPKIDQRRPGRSKIPEHLPRNETTLPPGRCPVCGGTHHVIVDTIEEKKLDAELAILQARVALRKVGRCSDCGTRIVAPAPPSPFPRSKLTCQSLALLVYLNVVMLLPLDRIREWFASMGVPMVMSFLVDMKMRAAKLLDAVDGEHYKQLMRGRWLGVDGTGHKVIIKGLPGTQHAYLEVFRNTEVVVFLFGLNKLGSTLAERLATFRGTVLCDAESRNGVVFDGDRLVEAGCNAHVRRALEAALAEQPLAAEAIRFVSRIYVLHERSRAQGLRDAALLKFRQEHIRPVYEQLRLWATAVRPVLLPSDGLGRVLWYLERQWDPLTRWLVDPDLPPDNNGCEREFQRVAKGRYAWLFFGGPEGGHRTATLLGIVATCRLHGVDPLAYLVWAFERLGTARGRYGNLPASELTPVAYKASLVEGIATAA